MPCDATQIGRFRRDIGEDGLEQLLKATIDAAAAMKVVKPADFQRVTVDTTVQEKAIAHPVDSRLLEIARHKVVAAAKRAGITLKQTFAKQGKELRRKAGGYAHAKQFKRLRRTVKRQRTILGIVMREIQRKLDAPGFAAENALAMTALGTFMTRAERIRTQQPKDKNKLYAMHAPEVECIGKGKARKPYEFGVKAAVVPQGPEVQEQATEVVVADECEVETVQARPHRVSWARLLKRVFDIDMQHCPNCGAGELKIIAAILERPVIEKILTHLGLDPQPPPRGRACDAGQDFAA